MFVIIFEHCLTAHAPIAQLDRAFDYESKGRAFESLRVRHKGNFRFLSSQILKTPILITSWWVTHQSLQQHALNTLSL